MPDHPFDVTPEELVSRLDEMVDITFEQLTSQFMLLPRGDVFVGYSPFLDAYEDLRRSTGGFEEITVDRCWEALRRSALSFVVIRTILGLSPPEWQDLTLEETGQGFPNNYARGLEGKVKRDSSFFARTTELNKHRVTWMLDAACRALGRGADESSGFIHRLEKIDTAEGPVSIRHVAQHGIPYAVLLYERYLGRPYASHRDAVSELVGDVMENAIEEQLDRHRVPHRKTGRAERVRGFDQAPDFFIPDEISPSVIIEAKITGDDGTARDKVARILRLAEMRDSLERVDKPAWELIACIDGRGFGVRRQDMRDLLIATRGKLFTAATLDRLVPTTALRHFAA